MSAPGRTIDKTHLSPELVATGLPDAHAGSRASGARRTGQTLAGAVEQVERDLIQDALSEATGNISEAARILGLTRRGLYLKLQRLGLDAKKVATSVL